MKSLPVLASHHQAGFCESLGFNVVGRFRGADMTLVDELDDVIRGGGAARVIVANLPEGAGARGCSRCAS